MWFHTSITLHDLKVVSTAQAHLVYIEMKQTNKGKGKWQNCFSNQLMFSDLTRKDIKQGKQKTDPHRQCFIFAVLKQCPTSTVNLKGKQIILNVGKYKCLLQLLCIQLCEYEYPLKWFFPLKCFKLGQCC